MILWHQIVDVLRESIFAYAQMCHGNLGYGIVAVTFLTRVALFPLMVRGGRAARAPQAAMAPVRPQLDALKARYKDQPQKIQAEMQRLVKREGISMVPMIGTLVQAPVFIAIYSAVRQAAVVGGRFLWIKDISRP